MNKFTQAQEQLQQLELDGWLIITNEDYDIHAPFMLGVKAHARHYVYVAAKGEPHIIAAEMEAPMIQASLNKRNISANVHTYSQTDEIPRLLKPLLSQKKIALNFGENILALDGTGFADYIRAGDFMDLQKLVPETQFTSAAPIIEKIRAVKTPDELQALREVCKTQLEILEEIPNWFKQGMTEKEAAAKLDYEYNKVGFPSFDTIIGSGPNSADPHHNTSTKKIREGVLLIDSGLKINTMCSDITWTFWVGTSPNEKFLKAYHTLYAAKQEANKYMIAGQPNRKAPTMCRQYLADQGYDHEKLYFHGLGHSIGFEVHDIGARLSWKVPEKYILQENMVYSNEPGLYWKGEWGIRLEDDIIIGKDKAEQVTYNHQEPLQI